MIECNWGMMIMLHYRDHEKPFLSALPVGFCFVCCVLSFFFSLYIYRRLSRLLYNLKTMFNSLYFLMLCLVRNQLKLVLGGFSFCDTQKYLLEKWWELVIHSAKGKRSKAIGACQRDSSKTLTDFWGKNLQIMIGK